MITLVSGLPRSGTALIMQMLQAGGMPLVTDDHRNADDDNPLGYFDYEPAKRTYDDSSWLPVAEGKAVKIKADSLSHLPTDGYTYKLIFIERDIREVVASFYGVLMRKGKKDAGVSEEKLMNDFTGILGDAGRWIAEQHIDVLYIKYHDIIENKIREAGRINDFLGGHLDTNTMAEAVYSKLYRQRSW
ncbi:MAG: hypothetical protein ACI9TH_004279 [Kiritimatiellia bacterium]|jgi:hypothetical protein